VVIFLVIRPLQLNLRVPLASVEFIATGFLFPFRSSSTVKRAGLRHSDATLVVAPASCMGQWENEVKSKIGRYPSVLQYHGANRKKSSPRE
jgi:SNF2 family DNA or RNA helicase